MVNVEAMEELRDTLLANPERHDQRMWLDTKGRYENDGAPVIDCKTTMCAAGWACTLAGETFVTASLVTATENTPEGSFAEELGKWVAPADRRAEELLGLSYVQADRLFYLMDETLAIKYMDELITEAKL